MNINKQKRKDNIREKLRKYDELYYQKGTKIDF